MSIFDKYPDTDFENFNLDWVIRKIKEITKEISDFVVINRITWGGLHNPGKEYPCWCIVDTPTHEGYISIQPVPAGITINNEDYWRQVANYSALYADFQNRIAALESDVALLNTKKILFIGDSIGTIQGADSKTYFELCGEHLGLTQNVSFFTAAFAGVGFTTTLAYPGNFSEVYDWFKTNYSSVDLTTITDVVICGGPNDINSTATDIDNAISSLVSLIKSECTNATVHIGISSRNSVNSGGVTGFHAYTKAYKTGALNCGAKWLEGLQYALYNNSLTSDHLHPNNDGVAVLGQVLTDAIVNGRAFISERLTNASANVTLGSGITSISNLGMFSEQVDNDHVYVSPDAINTCMVVLNAETSGLYSLDLFTMTDNIILSINNSGIPQQMVIFDWYDNNAGAWQRGKHGYLRKFYDTWKLEFLEAPLDHCLQLQFYYPGTIAMSAENC